jgi:hypothetical protein
VRPQTNYWFFARTVAQSQASKNYGTIEEKAFQEMIQVNALRPTLVLRHLLSMLTCDGAVMGASRCMSCAASSSAPIQRVTKRSTNVCLLVQPTLATAGTARRRVPRQAADAQTFERSSERKK